MQIWTWRRFPFIMGSPIRQAVKTDVKPISEPHDPGQSYEGYLITTPTGNTAIAETITGALVSDTLNDVRGNAADTNPETMRGPAPTTVEHARSARTLTTADPESTTTMQIPQGTSLPPTSLIATALVH